MSSRSVRDLARSAKEASRVLAPSNEALRNAALEAMAIAVDTAGPRLFAANAEDIVAAEALDNADKLSPSTMSRLKLTPAKLQEMVEQIRSVIALPDPLGRVLDAIELDDKDPNQKDTAKGLHLQKVSVPLGVLAVIFEARPDAVTQIAALAVKSGNAVMLKPGREVERTATVLIEVLREAVSTVGLPSDLITPILGREQANEMLAMHDAIDMVIPRGSKSLVEFVQANTRIPVLGHAEGICHIFVDKSADEQLALRVIEDAKLDYPAACNAVETVLVHRDIAQQFVPKLASHLTQRGVKLHGDHAVQQLIQADSISEWSHEYGEPELAIGVVDSLDAAITHIHQYGSSHTESILTEDAQAAERFLREVDAAGVYHNASTRFADGFRYGFGAEVGISTSKFHARGPVGLDGLTTYKYVLRGSGHVASDYRGGSRQFTHRREQS